MSEAKILRNEKGFEGLDIYVFTNGQHFSPPRKYHFTSEELNSWDETLKLLARSQYGSQSLKVELYTVEGIKVQSPLELGNSAAYVAIKPPDAFIEAGYNQYLMKASRSWERRQEQIFKTREIPNNACNPLKKPEIQPADKDLENGHQNGELKSTEIDNVYSGENANAISKPKKKLNSSNAKKQLQQNNWSKNLKINEGQAKFKSKDVLPLTHTNRSVRKQSVLPQNFNEKNGNDTNSKIPKSDSTSIPLEEIFNKPEKDSNIPKTNNLSDEKDDTLQPSANYEYESKNTVDISLSKQTEDKSVSVNTGGIVNLKLNIEVNDCQNCIKQDTDKDNLQILQSHTPFNITNKYTSQDNINKTTSDATLLEYNNDGFKHQEFKKSVVINRGSHTNNPNPQIIVINCACQQIDAEIKLTQIQCERTEKNDTYPMQNVENPGVMERCICFTSNSLTNLSLQPTKEPNNKMDVKDKEPEMFISPATISRPETAHTFCNKMIYEKKIPNLRQTILIDQLSNLQNNGILPKMDKYVQTGWCNMVLEARCQEDGRYSLHFPPLSHLIEYKLL